MSRLTASTALQHVEEHVSLAGGFEIVSDLPKSRDSYLADARDGRRYLDFHGLEGRLALGYNHPRLAEGAFISRLGRAALQQASAVTLELAHLVETFARVAMPESLQRLALAASDEDAIDLALKVAFDWKSRVGAASGASEPGAQTVLHFRHAYHGTSGWGVSLTNTAEASLPRNVPRHEWPRIASPNARFPLEGANLRDTEDREIRAVSEVRAALRERPHEIAAVLVEPVQGRGGDHHFRPEFLAELRRACDEFDVLLIFDETGTGGAASGTFWCWQQLEVQPDLLAFGGKVQVAGVLAAPRVASANANALAEPGRTDGAWSCPIANVVRAIRVLEVIESDKLAGHAKEMEKFTRNGLQQVAERDDRVTNIRARGLLIAFDLPSGDLRDRLKASLRDLGLLVLGGGLRSIRMRPPLSVKKAEIDHALGLVHDALKALR